MKNLILVLAATTLFAGYAASAACTADDVKVAQKFADLTADREVAGQVSAADVKIAKAAVIEMEYCAGTINKVTFCAQYEPVVRQMVDLAQTALEQGRSSTTHMTNALDRLVRVRTICN